MDRTHESILVMDDDPHVCDYLKDILEYFGYEVECVQSCSGAMQELKHRSFDGLLLDIWMDDGRGDGILDWLRERGQMVPVVMMSGLADHDLWVDLINRGAADLIPKPIAPDQLRRILKLAFHDHSLPTKSWDGLPPQ
jgi:DNA-binding NtrC family response regulator